MRTDRARRLAMTLTELLVVSAIVLIFTSTTVLVFVQMIRAADAVEAQNTASTYGRGALGQITEDLSQASIAAAIPRDEIFEGVSNSLGYGDLLDNDQDSAVDEESPDGLDNDGDWLLNRDDRDFQVTQSTSGAGGLPPVISVDERGEGVPDLGDDRVDEDIVFHSDSVSFSLRGPLVGNILRQQITYRVETFAGEDNVLVRAVRTVFSDGSPDTVEVEPLAFDVVSFNCLFWNHTTTPPRWESEWLSGDRGPDALPAPVSVHVEIVLHSDNLPLQLPPDRPFATERLATTVNLANVLLSPLYPRGEDRPAGRSIGAAGSFSTAPAAPVTGTPTAPATPDEEISPPSNLISARP